MPGNRAPSKQFRMAASSLRLLADIGGTFARFALQRPGRPATAMAQFRTADHPTLTDAIAAYLRTRDGWHPSVAAIAVAAPVVGDRVRMTNANWSFSRTALARRSGIKTLHVINDFEALAWSLDALTRDRRVALGGGRGESGKPLAVLGPGTGLGAACFVPRASGGPAAIATEGGHANAAATTAREAAVIDVLRRRFGHVSAERLLSGPGLANIYAALKTVDGGAASKPLRPGEIAAAARARGAAADAHARETARMFSALLGQFAGDLALLYGARGGVFIAGGVVGRLGSAFDRAGFRRRFEDKGRYRGWLADVPTWLIVHPCPAFLGLARYLDRAS